MAMKKWLGLLLLIGIMPYGIVYAAGPNECIDLRNDTFNNICRNKVTVRWVDEGHCEPGCAAYIPALDKHKIKSVTGKIRYATCYFPKVATGEWKTSNRYQCK
jgi:hypothetical protein